jgi:hypothetical protein
MLTMGAGGSSRWPDDGTPWGSSCASCVRLTGCWVKGRTLRRWPVTSRAIYPVDRGLACALLWVFLDREDIPLGVTEIAPAPTPRADDGSDQHLMEADVPGYRFPLSLVRAG